MNPVQIQSGSVQMPDAREALAVAQREIDRLRLQAEIDGRKIAEWRLAAELAYQFAGTPNYSLPGLTDAYDQVKLAMANARGEA